MSAPNTNPKSLSADHCLLLAAHFASESNISSLNTIASLRPDALNTSLLLQIILTYLPEAIEPEQYVGFIDTALHGGLSALDISSTVDISYVAELSASKARSRANKLQLLKLSLPTFPEAEYPEPIVQFIIHRAHNIEEQTGLVTLIPPLVNPFLERYPSLRTWFISCVLPLLRLGYEYYPDQEHTIILNQVELADNVGGVLLWLSPALSTTEDPQKSIEIARSNATYLARDLKGLMGPWMYGETDRKRRRLNHTQLKRHRSSASRPDNDLPGTENVDGADSSGWHGAFQKIVEIAKTDFPLVADAIDQWNGPEDLDLGGYVDSISSDDQELAQSYIQTAFASIYASELGSKQAAAIAWRILGRIGALMDIHDELPDLEDQAEQLSGLTDPKLEIKELPNAILDPESLLRKDHPLTAVSKNNLLSAQYFILSTFLLMHYGQSLSVIGTVKCKFHLDKEEQSIMFQKLLHHLATTSNRSDSEWMETRRRLLWLWGWGSEITDSETGNGIFGKASRKTIEKDILEALVQSGSYSTVTNLYIKGSEKFLLPEEAEQVIASTALHYYDNASNGNRHRGTMKKASDIIAAFAKYYPKSTTFPRLQALLAATHAMSSYSLTLQHGVPFQPVNIRVSSDPLSLIEKILSQNPGSYAKATDLVSIGTNLIAAGLTASADDPPISKASLETRQSAAQRRVIGMAIEAALAEDDFETAYSYVVNRLDTSSATMHAPTTSSDDDDIAWRAALAAGKHKSNSSAAPNTRRLEQRMDLLSQALLLAPPSALPEILSAWRRCEEEMSAVLAAEAATEAELDEGLVPGAYIESAAPVQARREVGRGANEEAPMGLFDVARGAAGAFAKSAFPLRGGQGTQPVQVVDTVGSDGEMGSDDGMGRVRRRDMVASAVSGGASAVTGGIASGLGWVLGATPVQNPPRQ